MKKKLFSRISAIFMALVLLVSMFSVLALAEDTPAVVKTLPNTSADVSLTIHKYDSDITTTTVGSEDGNLVHGTGNVIDTNDIPEGAVTLDGVDFTVEKVVKGGSTYTVKDIAGVVQTYSPDTTDVFKETVTTANGGIAKLTTDDNGLKQGIYYVTETNSATTGRSPVQPFVVELPMTNPDYVKGVAGAAAWIYDVHVYPKNQPIPFDKSVEEIGNYSTNNYIGQVQKWILTSVIPRDLVAETDSEGKEIVNPEALRADQEYTITDYMDEKLTYIESVDAKAPKHAGETLTVTIFSQFVEETRKVDDKDETFVNQIPTENTKLKTDKGFVVLEKGTTEDPKDYTVTTSKVTTGDYAGRTQIVIKIEKAGFNKIAKALGDIDGVDGDPALFIGVNLYSCINDDILTDSVADNQSDTDYLGQNIPNDAELNFKNEYTPEGKPGVTVKAPTSYTHTGGVSILKTDKDLDENKEKILLSGATFAIASSSDNAKAGHFLQLVTRNDVTTIIDVGDPDYINDSWTDTTAMSSKLYNQIYKSTTGTDGLAGFFGLEYGATVVTCGGAKTGCTDSDDDGFYDTHTDDCSFTQGEKAEAGSEKYYIVELVAPKVMERVQNEDGSFSMLATDKSYNLLTEPKEVTVDANSHKAANEIEVQNSKGFKLPTTGGIGTTILTVAGSALMVSAAVFFFVLKKKSKKSDVTAA